MSRSSDGSTAKPVMLVMIENFESYLPQLAERYEILYAPDAARTAAALREHGPRIRLVMTNGATGLRADQIDAMPALAFAAAVGAGYENLDVAHARARGIQLANGAGTNDDTVADHAFALLLGVVRAVPAHDRATREGIWRDALPARPQLARKKLGVIGLGTIGRKIAQRGTGFDMPVGYHNRTRRDDVAFSYFDSPRALAEWCDCLVVATPGGASTKHLVDAAVLKALGPRGVLVNIGRGSAVDTAALAQALQDGTIAGAGLDVYEGEPTPPAALIGLPNTVLSPHVAGSSPEAKQAMLDTFIENVELFLAGQPVRTPIPPQ